MRGLRLLPAALIAGGLLQAGCVYTFGNPVVLQDAGSISGSLALDGGAPGQIVGTRIDLLWSNLSIDLGHTGAFVFLDLPDGTYTLRYTVPPTTPGGLPLVGERLDLYLPFTTSGVPDTIDLGAISVGVPGTVEGNVTVDGGVAVGVVVGAFVPNGQSGGETGEYEGYATTTDSTGHYSLGLPQGDHTLWASSPTQAASIEIGKLQPGEDRTSQDLALATPLLPGSQLTGYVVIDPDGAHAPQSAVQPILSDPFAVALNPPCASCATTLSYGTPAPAQGVSAAQVAVTGIPAGIFYDVTCTLPSTSPPIPPVVLHAIPIIAGQSTTLKQIFLLTQTTLDANDALPLDGGQVVADAGADAGGDAGSDAGFDAGPFPDAGSIADAGPDSGSVTVPDAGFDAGPPAWTLVGAIAPTGPADTLIPLPSSGAHELLWSSGGQVSVVDDRAQAGTFGTPTLIWTGSSGSGAIADTLAGATFTEGAVNGAAWVYVPQSGEGEATLQLYTQVATGAWSPASSPAILSDYPPSESPHTLSLAYDSSANLWLSEVSDDGSLVIANVDGTDFTIFAGDGGSAEFGTVTSIPCVSQDLGGAAGICLAMTDSSQTTLWAAVFDPAKGDLVQAQPIYTAPASQPPPSLGVPSLTQQPGGPLSIVVSLTPGIVTAPPPSSYLWSSFSSVANVPALTPIQVAGVGETGVGNPGLFSWDGTTLFLTLGDSGTMDVLLPAHGSAGLALPSDAGTASPPYGYVDGSGTLFVGLISPTQLQLYSLSP